MLDILVVRLSIIPLSVVITNFINPNAHAQRRVTVVIEYICLSVCACNNKTLSVNRKPVADGSICVKSLPKTLQGLIIPDHGAGIGACCTKTSIVQARH